MTAAEPEIVYAIHNFVAENEDEIPFTLGDPIVVLEKDEKYQDGWWQGRNVHGRVGLFPMNYTTYVKPPTPSETPSTSTSTRSTPATTTSSSVVTPPVSNAHTLEDQIDRAISQVSSTPTSSLVSQPAAPPPLGAPPPAPTNPEAWSIDEVADWLRSVGLENVVDIFIDQEITGDILLNLTIDSLKELGIAAYGRRYKVMAAIDKLSTANQGTLEPLQTNGKYTSTTFTSTPSSPVDTDSLYQFPRKAPLPPQIHHHQHQGDGERTPPVRRGPVDSFLNQPTSPKSFQQSPSISRSNTFQTVSSKLSSSSGGTYQSNLEPRGNTLSMPSSYRGSKPPSQFSTDSERGRAPSIASSPPRELIHPKDGSHKHMLPVADPMASLTQQVDRSMSIASMEPTALSRSSTSFQAPEHEGWLHKQGDKYKTWNKRWFVLKGPNLFYFKGPKEVRMKGIIHLRGYRIVVDESIHAGKYSFKAQHETERTFYFYADTADTLRMWVKVLMKATITRDFTSPVMSSNHVATVPLDVARRMRPRPPSVIMYKTDELRPAMGQLQEHQEEEGEEGQQFLRPLSDNTQTRESGVIVYGQEEDDDVPDKFMHAAPAPTLSTSLMLSDEEDEDLIDPHHKPPTVQSPPLQPAFVSDRRGSLGSEEQVSMPGTPNSHSQHRWPRSEYIKWINQYLPPGKQVIDLTGAFRHGDTLILLLENLSGKTVRRPPTQKGGSVSMLMLDSIVSAFKFMGREGVVVDGRYTIKDIFGGNESKIMDMLDAIKAWAEENQFEPGAPKELDDWLKQTPKTTAHHRHSVSSD